MKNIILLLLVLIFSCRQPILEKSYNKDTFSKDSIELFDELDERTFSSLMVYIKDFKHESLSKYSYKELVDLADEYMQDLSVKEIEKKDSERIKILCSKKWYIKNIKTAASGEDDSLTYEVPEDNLSFEKGAKWIVFNEDNTFEMRRKGETEAEAEKGKWYLGADKFSYDGDKYEIEIFNEQQIVIKSLDVTSYGELSVSIHQTIEFVSAN